MFQLLKMKIYKWPSKDQPKILNWLLADLSQEQRTCICYSILVDLLLKPDGGGGGGGGGRRCTPALY